jgi:hypothetical protein
MSRSVRRPRYADVVGTLALVVAMSGTAYAATSLPRDSVGARQVKDNAIRSSEIRDGQVGSAELADGGVGSADLAAGGVGSAQLAAGGVGSAQLQDGAATGVDVKDESLSLGDLVGADVSGTISLSVAGNSCIPITLESLGLQPGQSAFLTIEGTSGANLMFGPLQVTSVNQAGGRVCNLSAGLFDASIPVRVVSFG